MPQPVTHYKKTNSKYAAVTGATSGNNELVGAVAGKKIRVLALAVVPASGVAFRLESGAGETALSGVMTLTTAGFVWPHNPDGWTETAAGAALNMELGGAVQVSGVLVYELID